MDFHVSMHSKHGGARARHERHVGWGRGRGQVVRVSGWSRPVGLAWAGATCVAGVGWAWRAPRARRSPAGKEGGEAARAVEDRRGRGLGREGECEGEGCYEAGGGEGSRGQARARGREADGRARCGRGEAWAGLGQRRGRLVGHAGLAAGRGGPLSAAPPVRSQTAPGVPLATAVRLAPGVLAATRAPAASWCTV